MDRFSYLGSADVAQIDDLYKQFRNDPASVTEKLKPASKADGVEFLRTEGGAAVFKVQAGKYSFAAR